MLAAVSVLPAAGVISFARGIPAPELLPVAQLAECAGRAANRVSLNYGAPFGYEPLREWLAERHDVTPERVIVTPGSLIALNFIVGATRGRAIVEAPTYDRMLHALGDAEVVAVRRGDGGVDLDELAAAVTPDTRFLYVLPTFHNPTGRSLTGAQRRALADFASERGLLVYEDDPYRDVRIEGTPEPSLHSLLPDELCVFTSSFSKTVAPGLRVGYAVLPPQLVAPVAALATRTYVSPPLLAQAQLLEFLEAGHLEPHLAFLGRALGERRDALLAELEALRGIATWTRPEGGYFLWLEQPLHAAALLERARAAGVAFVPGASFGGSPGSARLAFSYASVDEIHAGARRLAELVRAGR
jgi:DNA-binding transcriptional MocR family regulator